MRFFKINLNISIYIESIKIYDFFILILLDFLLKAVAFFRSRFFNTK